MEIPTHFDTHHERASLQYSLFIYNEAGHNPDASPTNMQEKMPQ